jgi:hypothetical protein
MKIVRVGKGALKENTLHLLIKQKKVRERKKERKKERKANKSHQRTRTSS